MSDNEQRLELRGFKALAIVAMSLSLLGCIGEEPPKCESTEAINLAKNIIANQIIAKHRSFYDLDSTGISYLEHHIDFQYARPTAYDKQIKKYSCEADVILSGKKLFAEQVRYESQLTSEGFIVNVMAQTPIWDAIGYAAKEYHRNRNRLDSLIRNGIGPNATRKKHK